MNAATYNKVGTKIAELRNRISELDTKINFERDRFELEDIEAFIDERFLLEKKISQIEQKLSEAESSESIGKKFKVQINAIIKDFEIVIPTIANPIKGLISINSPLAQALVSSKPGETVEVDAPAGKIKYKVLS